MAKWKEVPLGVDTDVVNRPPHYNTSKIECIDAMEAMATGVDTNSEAVKLSTHQAYLWQNIFKYLWRWPYKRKPLEDLKKAQWYLNRLIQQIEGAENGK